MQISEKADFPMVQDPSNLGYEQLVNPSEFHVNIR